MAQKKTVHWKNVEQEILIVLGSNRIQVSLRCVSKIGYDFEPIWLNRYEIGKLVAGLCKPFLSYLAVFSLINKILRMRIGTVLGINLICYAFWVLYSTVLRFIHVFRIFIFITNSVVIVKQSLILDWVIGRMINSNLIFFLRLLIKKEFPCINM